MGNRTYTLDFQTFQSLIPKGRYRTIGQDFILAEMERDSFTDFMKYPIRFNGYVVFYCIEGRFTLDLNLKAYDVAEGSLIFYTPGNIAKVTTCTQDESKRFRFIVAAASHDFITGARMDFGRLYEDSLITRENPCIQLDSREREILSRYYALAGSLLSIDNMTEALKSLCSSAFSFFGSLWASRLDTAMKEGMARKTRSSMIFESFVKLVSKHHSSEHNVGFYAESMSLTPKYLSKLVKEVSGKSAPDWIDSFIILEAKNQLKYSDMSIKEIAFNLHFSTVPSFYKFFRKQTGMTPADYRKM